jgi:chromosome partitioning protein
MARVITIANQKGGCAKSTTAQALIEGLRKRGFKVLGIDLDSQGNLTQGMNREGNRLAVYDLLEGGKEAQEVVEGDFIASNEKSALLTQSIKPTSLKEAIKPIARNYDYIIIDTPPHLDLITIAGLVASGEVVITCTPNTYSLNGITQTMGAIESAKAISPGIKPLGVLFTLYNDRRVMHRQLRQAIIKQASASSLSVFDTTIRESIAISEAQAFKQPLYEYAKGSKALRDYEGFIKELLAKERGK